MKKLNLEFILFTAAGAVIGAMAVESYRSYKKTQLDKKKTEGIPKELLIIDKL